MSVRSVACPVLVGREAELDVLQASAAAIRTGGGRTVLIGGEAGGGKSRMTAEAARIAEAEGFRVLPGACLEGGGVAYAPFVGALRRHTRTLDAAGIAELFGGGAQLAASLLPEVGASLGVETGGDSTPEHLHAAFWQLLRRVGAERPVMLVVEDLHWASPDTLRLTEHLAAEAPTLPLWLVVTYRVDELHRRHPLTPVLTRMRRLPGVDEVRLEPLDRERQRVMLSALFGGTEVGDEFLDAVTRRTGGNPFFIEELSASLVERGDIFESGGDWERRSLDEIEMPLTVRETLLARATRLDDGAYRILQLAAVAGERIEPAVVARAAGADAAAVDAALVAALDLHLVAERREGASTVLSFRHALTREALVDDLVGPERRHAHRNVAEALVEVHAGADAAAAAAHFEHAGELGRAAEMALTAAGQAVGQHAPAEAARLYEQALRLLPADDDRRLALLLEAAAGTYSDAENAHALAFARDARRLAREVGDPVAEARAMRWLWEGLWRTGDSQGAGRMEEEALRLVEGRDDRVEAFVLQALSRHHAIAGRTEQALEYLPRARELAARVGDHEILSQAHNTQGLMARTEEENIAAFDEAVRVATEGGAHLALSRALTNGGYSALWFGTMSRGVEWLARAVEFSERMLPGQVTYIQAGLDWGRALTGDLDAAATSAGPLRDTADVAARMVALTALAEVALRRGDIEAARRDAETNWELAEPTREGQRTDLAVAHLARVRMITDGPGAAAGFTRRFLEREDLNRTHAFTTPDLAQGLRLAAETDLLGVLVRRVERITEVSRTRHNRAALQMCRAQAAAAAGDVAGACGHFARAAAAYRHMPYPAREAEALLGLAGAELARGESDAAATAATSARDVAGWIGAGALVVEAEALLGRARADLVLATVLVTDIVGSTERAAALGDRAWRELLSRHHGIVRRELERGRGREIDTAGDGFLAAFESPARALRSATAIVAALEAAGITVRAGVHTGECEAIGDKLAGIAVHTAARVAAAAGPGQVLVSGTVRDLVAGGGFAFTDRGVHALKGVPGEWRLFSVAAGRPESAPG